MKRTAYKLGIMLMLAAVFTVAAHIYQHCAANTEGSLNDCPVCQCIMAASVHAAQPAEPELAFVRDADSTAVPAYFFSPEASDHSRAPPSGFFS